MNILGYHVNPTCTANSEGQVCQAPEDKEAYLAFLLEPHPDTIKVFRNLDYATANLLKLLNITKLDGQRIWDTKQFKIGQFELEFGFGKTKWMSLKYGPYKPAPEMRPFAGFADMEQYEKWEVKDDQTDTQAKEDCIKEAQEAQHIGSEVYSAFGKLGLHPTSLTSPIRAYEREVLAGLDIPTINDIPEEAWKIAWECLHGNQVEAYAKGYWNRVWDIDLTSAYGIELMRLPELRQGEWSTSKPEITAHNYWQWAKFTFGFIEGDITITSEFCPLIFERRPDEIYTPRGTWHGIFTSEEIDLITSHNLGQFKPTGQAYWWTPKRPPKLALDCPLAQPVYTLYSYKGNIDDLCDSLIKRIGSGIWGRMQFKPDTDRMNQKFMFNPVYAALVESKVRLKVAQFCLSRGVQPLSIAVDGCVIDREVKCPDGWKLSYTGPGIVVSSGIVALEDKSDTDFSLGFHKLKDMILADPLQQVYTMNKIGYVSLGRALQENRWADLGKVETVKRSIDVEYESKRYFERPPHTGGELLSGQYWSEAWNVHELKIGGLTRII